MSQADVTEQIARRNVHRHFNAFVPADAPIQPPQAFVDNILNFPTSSISGQWDLSGQDLTAIAPLIQSFFDAQSSIPRLDLSGNALGLPAIVDLLEIAAVADPYDEPFIDLSGGTNAEIPLSEPMIFRAGVQGWETHFNFYGGVAIINGTTLDLTAIDLTTAEMNEIFASLLLTDIADIQPITIHFSAGSGAVSGIGLDDYATAGGLGWITDNKLPGVVVANCGETAFNGEYRFSGTDINGHPSYEQISGGRSLRVRTDQTFWVIPSTATPKFRSDQVSRNAWEIDNWASFNGGTLPVPTITEITNIV